MNLFPIILLYVYSRDIENGVYGAKAAWTALATSNLYANSRMATEDDTYFEPRYISKSNTHLKFVRLQSKTSCVATPQFSAKMGCAASCVADANCRAFSFYETDAFYVCELAPDNYCSDQMDKVLIKYPGSFVWDKLPEGSTLACFEALVKKGLPIPCEKIRSGCSGNWPNCTKCVRTCSECYTRYPKAGQRTCTVWPDGDDASTSVPLISKCYYYAHTLMNRKVNATSGQVLLDYRMSFLDISRIERLNQYIYFKLTFWHTTNVPYYATYKIGAIELNGTLTNTTFYYGYDVLKTGNLVPKQVPFVTVTDDIYGCGSFWLVNPNNATYCPGGSVRMFGTPIVKGIQVISTGMRYGDIYPTYIYNQVEVSLSNTAA